MTINLKDFGAGLLFIAIGLFFTVDALLHLRVGSALNMGPGYFPLVLGGILCALGAAIAVASLGKPNEGIGPVPWHGILMVIGGILFFAVTVRGLGFALALAGGTLMAALSSRRLRLPGALILAAAVAAFGVLVFVYGLRLPYPVLGRWITG